MNIKDSFFVYKTFLYKEINNRMKMMRVVLLKGYRFQEYTDFPAAW